MLAGYINVGNLLSKEMTNIKQSDLVRIDRVYKSPMGADFTIWETKKEFLMQLGGKAIKTNKIAICD